MRAQKGKGAKGGGAKKRKKQEAAARQSTTAGVSLDGKSGKWRASVTVNGTKHGLGYHNTEEDAKAARAAGEEKYGSTYEKKTTIGLSQAALVERIKNTTYFGDYGHYPGDIIEVAKTIYVMRDVALPPLLPFKLRLTEEYVIAVLCAQTPNPDVGAGKTTHYPIAEKRQQTAALHSVRVPGLTPNALHAQIKMMAYLYKAGIADTARRRVSILHGARQSFRPASRSLPKAPQKKRKKAAERSPLAGVTLVARTPADIEAGEWRATAKLPAFKGPTGAPHPVEKRQCASETDAGLLYDEHCRRHNLIRRVNFPTDAPAKAFLKKCKA